MNDSFWKEEIVCNLWEQKRWSPKEKKFFQFELAQDQLVLFSRTSYEPNFINSYEEVLGLHKTNVSTWGEGEGGKHTQMNQLFLFI